ncbi:rhamnogalacturonan acetylesterase [Galbibacter sp. PAP.153]|uniref:rhamnogalacturonan acetylesterase n=1 Tax=Galbibacter sp. PAP.153 TaxID=3104623 RepID=UPI00300BF399
MFIKQRSFLLIIFIFSNTLSAQNPGTGKSLLYHFGNKHAKNAISITNARPFQNGGYGFDFETAEKVSVEENAILAKESVYFSITIPEGNYKVEVQLGSDNATTCNTVKVESRRVMISEEKVKAGQSINRSFTVEVKSAQINSEETVKLKDREKAALNWDKKLTFEFAKGTAIQQLTITKQDTVNALFLAGDSTVTDQDLSPWASWGQFITQYFNDGVVVANYASSGASLASFKGRKRWDKILSLIKKGDYVMIEFGHNDEKRKGENDGPWQSYTDLLKEYVISARKKGANPILVTPTQRRSFKGDGTLNETHGDYPDAMRKVALELHVPLIDLTKMTTRLYEAWGDEESRNAFVQYPAHTFPGQEKKLEDNTHFNDFGANEIALCVVKGIKETAVGLEKYLIKTQEYSPENPNYVKNWTLPISPRFEATKPDGN